MHDYSKNMLYNYAMLEFSENIKNNFDFNVRQITKFSRSNYFEAAEEIVEIPEESSFALKYDIAFLKQGSTCRNCFENFYVLDILDKYFPIENKKLLRVLDIGSKNWFYAKGEYVFLKNYCKNLVLTGIELDAHRLYSNFYSRYETAKFYTKEIPCAKYLAQNLLCHSGEYDCIIWMLPFVKKGPHMSWGLPLKYFAPERLLAHAYNLLAPDAKMFIVNQGIEEYETQLDMIQKHGLQHKPLGEIVSRFQEYKNKRYGVIVYKND